MRAEFVDVEEVHPFAGLGCLKFAAWLVVGSFRCRLQALDRLAELVQQLVADCVIDHKWRTRPR